MNPFTKAIQTGLREAQRAERSLHDILKAFSDLSAAVNGETRNQLTTVLVPQGMNSVWESRNFLHNRAEQMPGLGSYPTKPANSVGSGQHLSSLVKANEKLSEAPGLGLSYIEPSNFHNSIIPSTLELSGNKTLWLVRVSDLKRIELANVEIPPSGYPCAILFGRSRTTCNDEKGLINTLSEILSSPLCGRYILLLQEPSAA